MHKCTDTGTVLGASPESCCWAHHKQATLWVLLWPNLASTERLHMTTLPQGSVQARL